MSSFGMSRNVHSLILSIQHFFCRLTMVLPTLHGALKDGFGETVVACDIPEPCKFLSLVGSQKRFMWTHKEVDLAVHLVIGLSLIHI